GECYFPSEMRGQQYYYPSSRGMEIKLKEKLDYLARLDQQSQTKRYE
ncbi:MAG: recombination factor protein RarA, partial [Paraglaciecola sp.]|nr:recombination factor protein RarA [Paraglaciecola sp.]